MAASTADRQKRTAPAPQAGVDEDVRGYLFGLAWRSIAEALRPIEVQAMCGIRERVHIPIYDS